MANNAMVAPTPNSEIDEYAVIREAVLYSFELHHTPRWRSLDEFRIVTGVLFDHMVKHCSDLLGFTVDYEHINKNLRHKNIA